MDLGFYAPIRSVPHPAYQRATLRLIERALVEAWRILREKPEGDFDMATADEDRITRELRVCLVNKVYKKRLVKGFAYPLFRINRESKYESYNGEYLDKMPDLHIDITRGRLPAIPSHDGLFVECKPVDRNHPAGSAYCNQGIARFVRGQYAWAMKQGMMIGYTRTGYTLPAKLFEAIAKRLNDLQSDGIVRPCPAATATGYAQRVHVTVHKRGFQYSGTTIAAPAITLRHLWLNRE